MSNIFCQANLYKVANILLQTAGTLVLHASIPFVYLSGYTYFTFMDDPHGQYYQVGTTQSGDFS